MDQKAKTEQGRADGSSEGRRWRVWTPLIEKVWLGQEKEEVRTSQASPSTPCTVWPVREPLNWFFPCRPHPWGCHLYSNLNLSCWASSPLFLCDRPDILFPDVFTPHSGDNLFALSEKVSGSWTFPALPVTESLRTEFRGRIPSPLEFYGHDITVFHLLWLPRSLLLFWLCLPPPFWKL